MRSAAERLSNPTPFQLTGTVLRADAESATVATDYGPCEARRAVSCLLEPEIDDLVLVAGDGPEQLYVVAVLERPGGARARLSYPGGDLTMEVPDGRFAVAAKTGIELVSGKEVVVASPELEVRVSKGRVLLDHLTYAGREIQAHAEKLKVVASTVDQFFERILQKVKRSYRIVEEVDHVRCGYISYQAEKNVDLRGQNTLITAAELVKLDGDQIHLG